MADVFISYKRDDRVVAERLSISLEQVGFDVWWDFELLSGDRYRKVIRSVIDQCAAAVVLWSALAVESDFVMDEAGHAKSQGKLCPARIDAVSLPLGFGQVHTDDLSNWDGELSHPGFQALVRAIEARVGRKARLGSPGQSPMAQAATAELDAFKAAQLAGNLSALKAFASAYPRGVFAGFVRNQIETIEAGAHAGAPSDQGARDKAAALALLATSLPSSRELIEEQRGREGDGGGDPPAPGYRKYVHEALAVWGDLRTRRPRATLGALAAIAATLIALAWFHGPDIKADDGFHDAVGRGAYDLSQLNVNVRAAALSARALEPDALAASARARAAAARALDAAARARAGAVGSKEYDYGDGRRYEGDWSSNTRLGYGLLTFGPPQTYAGDTYAGHWRGGFDGVGVYSFAFNANNTDSMLRQEGSYRADKPDGPILFTWRDGRRYAGGYANGVRAGPALFRLSDGRLFEGQFAASKGNGYGVLWNADGSLNAAGLWADDKLVTPLTK